MTPEIAVNIISKGLWVVISMVTVLILPSLVIGLIVAIFQAVTQVNEQTLSFFPRLLMTMFSIIIAGHWLTQQLIDFFNYIFHTLPTLMV